MPDVEEGSEGTTGEGSGVKGVRAGEGDAGFVPGGGGSGGGGGGEFGGMADDSTVEEADSGLRGQ